MTGILTFEKLMKMKELLKGPPKPKEEFFKKFLPNVKDCSDWVVIFPEHMKLPEGASDFNWIKQSKYVTEIIAVDTSEFSNYSGFKQPLS